MRVIDVHKVVTELTGDASLLVKEQHVSAYIIIESAVKDEAAMQRYAAAAGQTLAVAGAEFLARGPWEMLSGEPYLTNGGLLRFPDREAALAWYKSPDYQALFELHATAMDSRFRLLA